MDSTTWQWLTNNLSWIDDRLDSHRDLLNGINDRIDNLTQWVTILLIIVIVLCFAVFKLFSGCEKLKNEFENRISALEANQPQNTDLTQMKVLGALQDIAGTLRGVKDSIDGLGGNVQNLADNVDGLAAEVDGLSEDVRESAGLNQEADEETEGSTGQDSDTETTGGSSNPEEPKQL
ncbi:hypothetical protein MK805_06825 [Shimazuella sp. AN120528]|uniref:hypothetical protein n=1 Tax=Shimazuella soli TaxID=1892854 RepID=UPI001F0E7085|nr:hypothetical protein [Shimazuella soli]MCH5584683.1 hypothetical protein [Shimazuella soli]